MKRVIHIEDQEKWRERVRSALLPSSIIEELVSIASFDDFRKANYPQADLYICDRHLPDKKGGDPDDSSWKQILDTIFYLHPYSQVVLLSSHPPRNWRKYRNIIDTVSKEQFNFVLFKDLIEKYLANNAKGNRK